MESRDRLELLQMAVQQLIEEEKSKDAKRTSSHQTLVVVCQDGDESDDDRRLLSKLLSQTIRADVEKIDSTEVDKKSKAANESSGCSSEVGAEDIVKELKKFRRQNIITHCLLSAMIVLTVAWQLSEVSLILKVQEGLSHPLRFLGSMFSGMLKVSGRNDQAGGKARSAKQNPIIQASCLPGHRLPELPRVELPVLDTDNNEE